MSAHYPGLEHSYVARAAASSPWSLSRLPRPVPRFQALPSVTDGDTLRIGSERIRLHGIDAPESKQSCRARGETWACGAAATRALRERIGGRSVECAERDRDRYGRIVVVSQVVGVDVNAWMVEQGWPLRTGATRRIASRRSRLQRAPAGACGGPTSSCRRAGAAGRGSAAAAGGAGDYRIKGNVRHNGSRIDTAKGERWFCTEAEARAAGWRRAKR